MQVRLKKYSIDGIEFTDSYLRQDVPMIINNSNPELIARSLNTAMNNLKELFALWMSKGSGWELERILVVYQYQ